MTQNIYDDPEFHAGYSGLRRQVDGLDGAPEWPDLAELLPDPTGLRVVDLGCGFGWFSRWADEHGARSVVGVDVSTKMLQRARADTSSPTVGYLQADLDELDMAPDSTELVFSSLTFHYVNDIRQLFERITTALASDGTFVFSIEHPIYSAPTNQSFEAGEHAERIWPLDSYLIEGERTRSWFVDGVVKQHRTMATYVNALVEVGLRIDRMVEWGPSATAIEADPPLADDLHRPWFLLVRATKPSS